MVKTHILFNILVQMNCMTWDLTIIRAMQSIFSPAARHKTLRGSAGTLIAATVG
jgi:hypothetical protein